MNELAATTLKLPKIIQNLLFYRVWDFKGRICGVHNDFGKLSFLQSSGLAMNYYCTQQEQIEFILELTNNIEEILNNN
jgi:hypothetical protein